MKPSLSGRLLVSFILISIILISVSFYITFRPYQSAKASFPDEALPRLEQPTAAANAFIPATRSQTAQRDRPLPGEESLPRLEEFIRQVDDSTAFGPLGLYVNGKMALRIVQQPNGDPKYVSQESDTATQFYRARLFGTIGLLAHNFLSGREFLTLQPGQDLIVVYGDRKIEHFKVSEITDYQRMTLADIHSDFMEVNSGLHSSADQVFARYYERGHVLTLQTCLARNGVSDWGVRFIMAEPVSTAH